MILVLLSGRRVFSSVAFFALCEGFGELARQPDFGSLTRK
jgi:hypothetical protein